MKNKWLEKYVDTLLNDTSVYHNHKETMAHAAFLLEVALCGAIITMDKWPLTWIPNIYLPLNYYLSSKTVIFLGFSIVWITIHIFIRWQLRNRRWAAIQFAGVLRTIRKWINEPPTDEDLKPYKDKTSQKLNMVDYLDFIIILPKANIISDVNINGELSSIVNGIREQKESGTGAILAESILTYGSIAIFFFVGFRTYWGI